LPAAARNGPARLTTEEDHVRARGIALVTAIVLAVGPAEPAWSHSRYVVRWGDTLTGIAAAQETTVAELVRINRLRLTDVLFAGSSLRLPTRAGFVGWHSYIVRRGDTLSAIAVRHGTTVSALAHANGLRSANVVLAGGRVRVPARSFSQDTLPAATSVRASWSVRTTIDRWSRRYGIDPHLARALAWMESGYKANVFSPAGAWGPMQVTPSAWAFVEDVVVGGPISRTTEGNIRVGVAYLHHLLHEFGGVEPLALAAYYQGAQAVRAYGLFPETRAYVADVLALKPRV
jgi:LysM repeat protein